tara:strand:- start:425 stop:526 length:102 start_codon:yes stop_codon:yes gene_type:complete
MNECFNKIWKKYYPHLSPKEAHAEIMKDLAEEE